MKFNKIFAGLFLISTLSIAAHAQSVSENFLGDWSGEVLQADIGWYYWTDININQLQLNQISGTSDYPTLQCGGNLTLVSVGANQIRLFEHITFLNRQIANCVDGYVVLNLNDINHVNFNWYLRNGRHATFDQTLNRSQPILCNNPQLEQHFSPHHPSYHHYDIETEICDMNEYPGDCSVENVFNFMKSGIGYQAPAPGGDFCKPVVNCASYDLVSVFTPNRITTTVDSPNHSATNFTLPGHLFHPGFIRRTVLKNGHKVVVRTHGEGVGSLPLFNELFGPELFRNLDYGLEIDFAIFYLWAHLFRC